MCTKFPNVSIPYLISFGVINFTTYRHTDGKRSIFRHVFIGHFSFSLVSTIISRNVIWHHILETSSVCVCVCVCVFFVGHDFVWFVYFIFFSYFSDHIETSDNTDLFWEMCVRLRYNDVKNNQSTCRCNYYLITHTIKNTLSFVWNHVIYRLVSFMPPGWASCLVCF